MKYFLTILLTLALAVAIIWFYQEYERTGNMKAVGDEWTRLSTTTVDSPTTRQFNISTLLSLSTLSQNTSSIAQFLVRILHHPCPL
jgi:hypothetical protein